MLGSIGGSRFKFASLIPLIMSFFGGKGNAILDSCSSKASSSIFSPIGHSNYGTSSFDYGSIMQARRKVRRGKMYKRYGHRLSRIRCKV